MLKPLDVGDAGPGFSPVSAALAEVAVIAPVRVPSESSTEARRQLLKAARLLLHRHRLNLTDREKSSNHVPSIRNHVTRHAAFLVKLRRALGGLPDVLAAIEALLSRWEQALTECCVHLEPCHSLLEVASEHPAYQATYHDPGLIDCLTCLLTEVDHHYCIEKSRLKRLRAELAAGTSGA